MSEGTEWDHHPGSPVPQPCATSACCSPLLQTQLTSEEKEWLVVSATADYQGLQRLLAVNGRLASLQDISNGYTALHWASKHGQLQVVKMMADRIGVNVNVQSHGGYTPMHLAAMQGHSDVIQLLLNVYKADPSIRDNSGKKAWQYLQQSLSSSSPFLGLGLDAHPPPQQHHHLCYSEGDWDVVLWPTLTYPTPPSRLVFTASSNSNSSSSSSFHISNSSIRSRSSSIRSRSSTIHGSSSINESISISSSVKDGEREGGSGMGVAEAKEVKEDDGDDDDGDDDDDDGELQQGDQSECDDWVFL